MNKPVDETGLVQVGARYYDPVIARFITVDPVMDLTDPQQWNAYTYANGNPVTWADPTGKWPDWLDDAASAVGDGISSAWDATTTWVDEHQADIVAGVAGAVVGGGCLLLTAGAGSIACGALGGAAAGAASHAWRAQVQHTEEFSWGAMGREALIGGVVGAATAGIGQIPGVRQAVGALANRVSTSAVGQRLTSFANSAREMITRRRLPVLEIDSARMPNIAANISHAQANGAPTVLNRVTSQTIIRANRAAATRGFRGRPMSPDEYPFASTQQGGSGAFVRAVPIAEQRIQGNVMSSFYRANRIPDGGAFRVRVV